MWYYLLMSSIQMKQAPINLPIETNEADGMNPDNNIEVTNKYEKITKNA